MNIEPGLNAKLPDSIDKPTKTLSEKQTAYKILREQGIDVQTASKSVGYTNTYGYQLEHKLKKFNIKGNAKLLKSANSALKHLVNGERFGDIKEIKDSTVLAAAKEIYDRHEPVIKQSLNLNLNADISPIDLSKYRSE